MENYQKLLEKILQKLPADEPPKRLLLHSCCAPCSSYVLEYLSQYFEITVFYYNPNIAPEEEYRMRVEEQKKLIQQMPFKYPVSFIEGTYDPERFYEMAKGLEKVPEGGERCFKCFRLRLEETAKEAVRALQGAGQKTAKEAVRAASDTSAYDYFTTTLTISPLKNAQKLNEIGLELAEKYGLTWLPSDFKKKNGYKRSTELSTEYGLYRQNYCGCIFSKRESCATLD